MDPALSQFLSPELAEPWMGLEAQRQLLLGRGLGWGGRAARGLAPLSGCGGYIKVSESLYRKRPTSATTE